MVALYVAAAALSGAKRLASRLGGQAAGAADSPGVPGAGQNDAAATRAAA